MKDLRTYLALLILTGCLLACEGKKDADDNTSAEEAGREIKEAGQAAGDFISQEFDDFRSNSKERLAELDKRIAEAREEIKGASGETREELSRDLDGLELKRNSLKEKMDKAGEKTKENWKEFKTDVEQAFDEIEDDLDKRFDRKKDNN